jgi:hypothetical protein
VDNIKTYFITRGSGSGSCPLTGKCIDYELPVCDTSVDYLISQFLSQLIYLFLDSADPKLCRFAEHLSIILLSVEIHDILLLATVPLRYNITSEKYIVLFKFNVHTVHCQTY